MSDRLFSARRVPGKLLRAPLHLIPRGTPLRILVGPGHGLRWLAGSGPHSCWLGFNELRKRHLFVATVRDGDVVYDIGANVGFYSLIASQRVGEDGQVVAFEPLPVNLQWLRRHLAINGLANVAVEDVAVWSTNGKRRFLATDDRVTSHVSVRGQHTVRTVTLDALLADGRHRPPDHLKIDVEGAEHEVLLGAQATLAAWRPTVFLATHGVRRTADCRALLQRLGYVMHPIAGYGDEFLAQAQPRR